MFYCMGRPTKIKNKHAKLIFKTCWPRNLLDSRRHSIEGPSVRYSSVNWHGIIVKVYIPEVVDIHRTKRVLQLLM